MVAALNDDSKKVEVLIELKADIEAVDNVSGGGKLFFRFLKWLACYSTMGYVGTAGAMENNEEIARVSQGC